MNSTIAKSGRQGWSNDIEREFQPMAASRLSDIPYLMGWLKQMALLLYIFKQGCDTFKNTCIARALPIISVGLGLFQ